MKNLCRDCADNRNGRCNTIFMMKTNKIMKTLIKSAIIALALSLLIGLFVINRAQAKYISSLEGNIASRDSLIESILDYMELIYLRNNEK